MTSTMQTYARKTQIPIDTLTFRTEVRTFGKEDIKEVPEDGKMDMCLIFVFIIAITKLP